MVSAPVDLATTEAAPVYANKFKKLLSEDRFALMKPQIRTLGKYLYYSSGSSSLF